MSTQPPSVYAYLRISQDRSGSMVSVENQRADVHALAEQRGLSIDAEFSDNDVSAYGGRDRPGYRALVEAVKQGPCVVLAWHMDRLYRRPKELEALLDLVQQYPMRLETVRGGGLDLNAHEGQLQARLLVSMASYESGHKADRVRLAARRAAEKGAWHGPRRFGYQLDGSGSAIIDSTEGPVVREAVDRFLAGESLYSITRWLNGSGVTALHGGAWHTNTVRQLLASPRIAGLRSYQPREGASPDNNIFRTVIGPGTWEGIITAAEYERVVALLRHPSRTTTRAGENLLSGLARCGRCGAALVIASSGGRRRYVCKKTPAFPERGGLSIEQTALDDTITEAVVRRLAATPAPPRPGSEPAPLWEAVAAARARLDDLARDYGEGVLERREYEVARTAARNKLEAAERALARSTRTAAVTRLPVGDLAALRVTWAGMSVGQRRAVVEALVEELVIRPAGAPSRTLDLRRVHLRWRA